MVDVVLPLVLVLEDVEELDVGGNVVVVDVVVVGPGTHPLDQNTLCLTSAPWEPSALMVSLTWKPWLGWGSMPVKSRV